ncbi:PASTA domain-containing protein [bacterium]|nr:PASTA domain-containing protein [bacterium]
MLKYIAGILGLALLGVLLGWVMVSFSLSGNNISTPDLTGLSLIEAMKRVESKKLYLQLRAEQFDQGVPRDHIVSQDPAAGVDIKEGRTIYVIISKGHEETYVPDFVNQPWREVEPYLAQASLGIGLITRVHTDRFERDRVVAQQPLAGTTAMIGDKVNFLVSLGERSRFYEVPDWIGRNVSECRTTAARMKLRVEVTDRTIVPEYPSGTILNQKPLPGHQIREGDIISLVISRKSRLEDMRDVDYFPFTYYVPAGLFPKELRIVLSGPGNEELELLKREVLPEEKVQILVPKQENTYLKVYLNNEVVASEEPTRRDMP